MAYMYPYEAADVSALLKALESLDGPSVMNMSYIQGGELFLTCDGQQPYARVFYKRDDDCWVAEFIRKDEAEINEDREN